MNLIDWLAKDVSVIRVGPGETLYRKKYKIAERLAELIAVNGARMDVTQLMPVQNAPQTPYKRIGLTLQEALELSNWGGIFTGLLLRLDEKASEIEKRNAITLIQGEINKVVKEGFNPFDGAIKVDQSTQADEPIIEVYTEGQMKELVNIEKEVNGFIR